MNCSALLAFTGKIEGAYTRLCRPIYTEFNISKTSFDILMFLKNNPSYYTARDISMLRNIKPNVVSIHVEQLVRDGYLIRESVKEDRRKIRLVCTGKAEPILERGKTAQMALYRQMIQGLSEEELECFRHCFRVIEQNVGN